MEPTLRRLVERGQRVWGGLGRASRFLVALNAFCWLLFLTREPVNAADYAPIRAKSTGSGLQFDMSSGTPFVVASRLVAQGGWHGDDTAPVEAYRLLNRPALICGVLLGIPLMGSGFTWMFAGALFLATTMQWGLIGRFVDRRLAAVEGRFGAIVVRRVLVATFVVAAAALTAWWIPAERDDYLLQSSFRGNPEPMLEALKTEPENAELWRRLGRSYRMKDRWSEALPAYRRSVDLDPTDFDAWADVRLSALCLKDEAEAERAAKRLFAIHARQATDRVEDPPRCCGFGVC